MVKNCAARTAIQPKLQKMNFKKANKRASLLSMYILELFEWDLWLLLFFQTTIKGIHGEDQLGSNSWIWHDDVMAKKSLQTFVLQTFICQTKYHLYRAERFKDLGKAS